MSDWFFIECRKCNERWKFSRKPLVIDDEMTRKVEAACCPNCGERKELFLCVTDGPNAATQCQDGLVT